jgi:hypothetical protein
MPHKIRASHIYKRAYELAEDSIHHNPAQIIATLVAEGYPESVELLNSENIRADLRQVCGKAAAGQLGTRHLDLSR